MGLAGPSGESPSPGTQRGASLEALRALSASAKTSIGDGRLPARPKTASFNHSPRNMDSRTSAFSGRATSASYSQQAYPQQKKKKKKKNQKKKKPTKKKPRKHKA